MKRLYVQPAFRKHKIGEALVEAIIQQAQQLNYAVMKLDTLERLQAAIQLYLKKGFIITNAYYPNPLPNVVYMEKQLDC
jgi:GNAT superfamily N-acetyltransferase